MDTIRIDTDARGVATLTLARADKRNAMSARMIDELAAAAATLGDDPNVRVVVLTGDGDVFCAGGDLGWMRDQMAADTATRAAGARALANMLGALDALPKPLIGRINGTAMGGGVGLACICDIAIGVDTARFGLTETRLGLIPATIGPYVVARLGAAKVRRVFMSSKVFGAEEAVDLGILARSVSSEMLDNAVEAEIAPYLAAAPGAVAAAKALARELGRAPGGAEVDASVAALIARWEGEEAREGIAAFFDKRKPGWVQS